MTQGEGVPALVSIVIPVFNGSVYLRYPERPRGPSAPPALVASRRTAGAVEVTEEVAATGAPRLRVAVAEALQPPAGPAAGVRD